jgi:hypothetical protein
LRRLRAALPERTPLSITALPAWMESPNLRSVLDEVDASVLQVHSVLDPKRGLFSEPLARRWYERYAALTPKPFWIALPNYGSRVSWDGDGRLLAVTSEGEEWARRAEDRELEADPAAVRRLLDAVEAERPAALRGVVWFRLPVRGDRRIWSAATFAVVLAGKPLVRELRWSIERDAQGAYRVALVNAGSADMPLPEAIRLRRPCRAADGLSGYVIERVSDGLVLRREGSAMLRAGETLPVGWTRCALGVEDIEIEGRN